jgi:predicted nucleotidyltransferase component of viral defense system
VETIKGLWNDTLNGLHDFGLVAEIRNAWQSEVGYSFDVSYQGPLFDGRDRTKGKVRVDVNLRQENVIARRVLVSSEYDDIRPFVVSVLSAEHLLAEKVRALVMRGKPRDLYDVWLLTTQGVRLDAALVHEKLSLYDIALSSAVLDEALKKAATDWERDLRPLLPQFIRWEEVSPTLAVLQDALQS